MAYFTAVLARSGSAWRARDVDLDDSGDLEALGDVLRSVAVGDEPVVALIEHEDEWFALFRVDGDDDPRLFVSDFPAASLSSHAELLAPAGEARPEPPVVPPVELDDDEAAPKPPAAPVWAGDAELLDDLGVSGDALTKLVEEHVEDPAGAIADVAEQVGFADLLEALR